MAACCRELVAGANNADALPVAQLETRDRYSHPRNWAAFVLVGAAE